MSERVMMLRSQRKKSHTILLISTIILILFFTFVVRETFEVRHVGSRGLMLIPFRELYSLFTSPNHSFFFWQIVLNILLFIPFGFSLSMYINCHKKTLRHQLIWTVLLTAFLLSTSVEVLQYLTSRGFTEVDDVINNTLGAVIGWWGYERVLKRRG